MDTSNKYKFCETISELDFENLSPEVIWYSKLDLIDTLGVMIAGSSAPGIKELVDVHCSWGGDPQSTVFTKGVQLPAPQAALINGSMAHALDFDDTLDFAGNIHVGASVVPAALAMAELAGGVSGKKLITAICAGIEISCKLANIAHSDRGWHRTGAFGIFGATVAACKVMDFEPSLIREALGIALSQASGTRQCILDGALTKRLQAGFAASNAVTSAIYAKSGLTGAFDPFWGEYGFFEMYQPDGYEKDLNLEDFGNSYLLTQLSFKPYPSGRPTHKFINAAIIAHNQMKAQGWSKGDISQVTVECSDDIYTRHSHNSDPLTPPRNQIEAQFHVAFLVISSLVNGKFGLEELGKIDQDSILALHSSFTWEVSGTYDDTALVGQLQICNVSGERLLIDITESSVIQSSSTVGGLVTSKFKSCVEHVIGTSKQYPIDLLNGLNHIEQVQNCTDITKMISVVPPV